VAIRVELRDETGNTLHRLDGYLEASDLPEYNDGSYAYLRLVDPNGDTVFSRYQMVAVMPELVRWAGDRESPTLTEVLDLARRCEREVHTYLVFIGD
jgi:hypothetical protein